MHITFTSAKGGAGCTTTAVAVALTLATTDGPTVLVGGMDIGVVAGIVFDRDDCGVTDFTPTGGHLLTIVSTTNPVAYARDFIGRDDTRNVIIDAGLNPGREFLYPTVLVARNCYLHLAAAKKRVGQAARVVLITEPGRAIVDVDFIDVLSARMVRTVPADVAVGRAIDAELLLVRLPASLERHAKRLIDGIRKDLAAQTASA